MSMAARRAVCAGLAPRVPAAALHHTHVARPCEIFEVPSTVIGLCANLKSDLYRDWLATARFSVHSFTQLHVARNPLPFRFLEMAAAFPEPQLLQAGLRGWPGVICRKSRRTSPQAPRAACAGPNSAKRDQHLRRALEFALRCCCDVGGVANAA